MKYPGNFKKNYTKNISYANRGMDLENIINEANTYYLNNDLAVIYKISTPITVLNVSNNKINSGFYKEKSSLDYAGIYKGKHVEFDAKETKLSYLPLNNIHEHQLLHMKRILHQGGITFLIICIKNEYYLLEGKLIFNFIDTTDRKSIPYEYIKNNGKLIKYNYLKGLDYLELLEELK
ncbi:MAG: Holliday junction resolvase RecU [bacterium]